MVTNGKRVSECGCTVGTGAFPQPGSAHTCTLTRARTCHRSPQPLSPTHYLRSIYKSVAVLPRQIFFSRMSTEISNVETSITDRTSI